MTDTHPTHSPPSPPLGGLLQASHPGDAALNPFFISKDPKDLPPIEVLEKIFPRCAQYTRCPKCLAPESLANQNSGKTIICKTEGCFKKLGKEMLPAAYYLGMSLMAPVQTTAPAAETMQTTMMMMITRLIGQIEQLSTTVATLQRNQVTTVSEPAITTNPANAPRSPPSRALYSQAHVEKPTHSIAWSKIAANCPDNLKETLEEIRKESNQQDRTHRRNRKNGYSSELVSVFVDGIPRLIHKCDEQGKVLKTRKQRTESFLQAARVQMGRIHSFFPRGYRTYEFCIEKDYKESFEAHLVTNMNCRILTTYDPHAPRNREEATTEQKDAQIRMSVEHYVRESSRPTATDALKRYYKQKGIALIGEDAFNVSLANWSPYRKPSEQRAADVAMPESNSRIRPRQESVSPVRPQPRQDTTQPIAATTVRQDVEMTNL